MKLSRTILGEALTSAVAAQESGGGNINLANRLKSLGSFASRDETLAASPRATADLDDTLNGIAARLR